MRRVQNVAKDIFVQTFVPLACRIWVVVATEQKFKLQILPEEEEIRLGVGFEETHAELVVVARCPLPLQGAAAGAPQN